MTDFRFGMVPGTPPPPALVLQRHDYKSTERTVMVLGVMRGGTSAAAAVVSALGVDMIANHGNFEENEIKLALRHESGDLADVIARRNQEHVAWGFKYPDVVKYRPAAHLHPMLRNPYYVIVTKDLAAVVQTHLHVTESELVDDAVGRCLSDHIALWEWIHRIPQSPPAPQLLLSYQRLLHQPRRACQLVADFLGLTPSEATLDLAVRCISPTGGYLQDAVPRPEDH